MMFVRPTRTVLKDWVLLQLENSAKCTRISTQLTIRWTQQQSQSLTVKLKSSSVGCMNKYATSLLNPLFVVEKQKRRAESARSSKFRSRNYVPGSRLNFADL